MKKNITAKLTLALLLGSISLAANAQNVIEEGVAFKPEANTVYEFTPTSDGNLVLNVKAFPGFMYFNNWSYFLFTEADHNEDSGIPFQSYNEISDNDYNFNYQNIQGGETYYFYAGDLAGADFTLTMQEYKGEAVAKVTPSPQSPFNYVVMQEIQIFGSSSITDMGKVYVKYGSESVELDPTEYIVGINGGGGNFFIQITGVAFQKLVSTIANSGIQSFTVTVEDVATDNGEVVVNESGEEGVTVENGTVSITYNVFPAAQYMAQDSTWPSPFYSYWEKNDPNGIATLNFNQEIASVGEVTLMMGFFTEGMITEMDNYDLTDNVTINGKEVKIDFTGVSRPSGANQVTVIVQNVKGANGLTANMSGSANSIGSTLFQYLDYSAEAAPENPDIPDVPDTPTQPEYMKGATQVNDQVSEFDSAVTLIWPETVTIVDAESIEIPVYVGSQLAGTLTSTYINLVGGGSNDPVVPTTRVSTGESGSTMYLLLGAAGILNEPGLYRLTLPEGMVMNAAGEINRAQAVAFTYVAQPEGVISPESGTTFPAGEDVIITISYEGNVEQNYSPDAPIIVTNYGEYDEQFNWMENVLYIEGNAIVLNLGSELEAGTYYLSLREGVVVVDGVTNAPIFDYMFIVEESATDGIQSIGAENGQKQIYNLKGVKINENNIGKGVYIINGKKVVVK